MYLSHFITISGEDENREVVAPKKKSEKGSFAPVLLISARYQFRHWAGISPCDLVPVMNGAAILYNHQHN